MKRTKYTKYNLGTRAGPHGLSTLKKLLKTMNNKYSVVFSFQVPWPRGDVFGILINTTEIITANELHM